MVFVLSLFVTHLSFFWCLGKAVLRWASDYTMLAKLGQHDETSLAQSAEVHLANDGFQR